MLAGKDGLFITVLAWDYSFENYAFLWPRWLSGWLDLAYCCKCPSCLQRGNAELLAVRGPAAHGVSRAERLLLSATSNASPTANVMEGRTGKHIWLTKLFPFAFSRVWCSASCLLVACIYFFCLPFPPHIKKKMTIQAWTDTTATLLPVFCMDKCICINAS